MTFGWSVVFLVGRIIKRIWDTQVILLLQGKSTQIPCPLITHIHCYVDSSIPSVAFHAAATRTYVMLLCLSAQLHSPSSFVSWVSRSHSCCLSLPVAPSPTCQFYLWQVSSSVLPPLLSIYPNFFWISIVNFWLAYVHSLFLHCPYSESRMVVSLQALIACRLKITLLTLLTKSCLVWLHFSTAALVACFSFLGFATILPTSRHLALLFPLSFHLDSTTNLWLSQLKCYFLGILWLPQLGKVIIMKEQILI